MFRPKTKDNQYRSDISDTITWSTDICVPRSFHINNWHVSEKRYHTRFAIYVFLSLVADKTFKSSIETVLMIGNLPSVPIQYRHGSDDW